MTIFGANLEGVRRKRLMFDGFGSPMPQENIGTTNDPRYLKSGAATPGANEEPANRRRRQDPSLAGWARDQAISRVRNEALDYVLGSGSAATVGTPQTFGGLPSSHPVASSIDSGTILADGSIAPHTSGPEASVAEAAAGPLSYAGAALGAYGLYNLSQNWGAGNRSAVGAARGIAQGVASGAAIGNVAPGVGSVIGGVAGGLYGLAGSYIRAGKHEDQKGRDAMRSMLKGRGVLDDSHNLRLNGNTFNIGVDGGPRPELGGRRAYELDPSGYADKDGKPTLQGLAAAYADPLTNLLSGGDSKLRTDFSGYYANAALKGAKDQAGLRTTMLDLYRQHGVDKGTALNAINEQVRSGKLDNQTAAAYQNSLNQLYGADAPAPSGQPSQGPRRQEERSKPKPKPRSPTPPQPTPTMADMIPRFSEQAPITYPDGPQTPDESEAVRKYREMLENFARGRAA